MNLYETAACGAEFQLRTLFYLLKFSKFSIETIKPTVFLITKKFKLLRLGSVIKIRGCGDTPLNFNLSF